MHRVVLISMAVMSLLCGCARRRDERVAPPALDVDAVTAAVMAKADVDRDGLVTQKEMRQLPALVGALAEMDTDTNGTLSKAELYRWFNGVRNSEVALSQLKGIVMHRRAPLANAAVTLVPEPIMGPGMATAHAVTDAQGRFAAAIPGNWYPGVHCGLYRVKISGTGNDGQVLRAFQGDNTPLGLAVGGMLPLGGFVTFTLDETDAQP